MTAKQKKKKPNGGAAPGGDANTQYPRENVPAQSTR